MHCKIVKRTTPIFNAAQSSSIFRAQKGKTRVIIVLQPSGFNTSYASKRDWINKSHRSKASRFQVPERRPPITKYVNTLLTINI